MAAKIAGFVTRAQAGLRKPRSVNRNVDPERGGLAVHYGGAGAPPSSHSGCVARWKSWQAFHMDGRGWSDIAYSFGYCQHGYVFAGRGYGIRTAANGTNDGNQRFLAACWIGGGTTAPTRAALDALEWIVAEVRRLGAARQVRPHRYFKSTDCPGSALTSAAAKLHNRSTTDPTPTPDPVEDDMPYKNWSLADRKQLAADVAEAVLNGSQGHKIVSLEDKKPYTLASFVRGIHERTGDAASAADAARHQTMWTRPNGSGLGPAITDRVTAVVEAAVAQIPGVDAKKLAADVAAAVEKISADDIADELAERLDG